MQVTYLGCFLDETLPTKTMALKALKKINGKLNFLYRKNNFLSPPLRRMLCNALIQPHFDYACSAWYPNLNEKLKKKIQIAQNKCVPSCLKLDKRHIIYSMKNLSNWTGCLIYKRVYQCINVITVEFVSNACSYYLNEVYEYAPQCKIKKHLCQAQGFFPGN